MAGAEEDAGSSEPSTAATAATTASSPATRIQRIRTRRVGVRADRL
jgi:hypothetical protein